MAWMSRWRQWWWNQPWPWRPWSVAVRVEHGDEIPAQLPFRGAALVVTVGQPRCVAFDCPCNRGHRVMLNLDPRSRPVWRLKNLSPLTIDPSVDDSTMRGHCHFFLHGGHVTWVRGRERTSLL
jgi:hypothetical protein